MVIKRDVDFAPAGEKRTLHVYLPEGYADTDERYPVMYFFDGHNLFFDEDATYGKSWGLKRFLDNWEKRMIVVGIECSHTDRLREYCPYHFISGFFGDLNGTGDATVKWMTETLKPVIDQRLRTYPFREATGIAGSSMGGLMAAYAVMKYNSVFSKAGCLSSAIGAGMSDILRDACTCAMDPDTRVYLSWGTEEAGGTAADPMADMRTRTAQNNMALSSALKRRGVNTRIYCQRGGAHCEEDWEKQVPMFMDYLWLDR